MTQGSTPKSVTLAWAFKSKCRSLQEAKRRLDAALGQEWHERDCVWRRDALSECLVPDIAWVRIFEFGYGGEHNFIIHLYVEAPEKDLDLHLSQCTIKVLSDILPVLGASSVEEIEPIDDDD